MLRCIHCALRVRLSHAGSPNRNCGGGVVVTCVACSMQCCRVQQVRREGVASRGGVRQFGMKGGIVGVSAGGVGRSLSLSAVRRLSSCRPRCRRSGSGRAPLGVVRPGILQGGVPGGMRPPTPSVPRDPALPWIPSPPSRPHAPPLPQQGARAVGGPPACAAAQGRPSPIPKDTSGR